MHTNVSLDPNPCREAGGLSSIYQGGYLLNSERSTTEHIIAIYGEGDELRFGRVKVRKTASNR